MTTRTIKIPGPDHPITIEQNANRVGRLSLGVPRRRRHPARRLPFARATYPPVQYIPRKDVDMAALVRSATRTYCPYKGEAAYFSIPARRRAVSRRDLDL